MRCWSPLTSTRCEPERLVSIHPSRFSAASTRAALAMPSTVEHGHVKELGLPDRPHDLITRFTDGRSRRSVRT
jgi:hypothetical protein